MISLVTGSATFGQLILTQVYV